MNSSYISNVHNVISIFSLLRLPKKTHHSTVRAEVNSMLKNAPFNLAEKLKWWESLSDEQRTYIYVGTASLCAAIRSNRPGKSASRSSTLIRTRFPATPQRGKHIKKGRKKLAWNLTKGGI